MNEGEDEGILSGQSSISWMGFTHTNNNSEDDVIGIPLWCTDIDRFIEFMHDGKEHSSNSEDNHLDQLCKLFETCNVMFPCKPAGTPRMMRVADKNLA